MTVDSIYIIAQNRIEDKYTHILIIVKQLHSRTTLDKIEEKLLKIFAISTANLLEIIALLNHNILFLQFKTKFVFLIVYLTSSYYLSQILKQIYFIIKQNDLKVILQIESLLLIQHLMYHIADVLKNTYKDELNSEKLKSNFSSLLIMLDHLMEKGHPLITQKQVLESLVQPQGVLDKIEEVVIGQNQHQNENFKVLEKYVDGLSDAKDNHIYRIKGLKCKEEILFDVIEYIDCILDKSGNVINNEVNGEIKMECQLSQYPLVSVYMTIPQPFDDFSVHETLLDQVDKFEQDKILIFNPPSGQTSLMYYNIKTQICRLPFNLTHSLEITKDIAKIYFKLNAQTIRGQEYKTDDFYIKIILPSELIQKEINQKFGTVSSSENAIIWRIGTIPKDESLTFTAILQDKNQANLKNSAFIACLKFSVADYSLSGTKIDKATVQNSAQSQRRLAKNITKSGHYEIRLN